MQQAGLRSRINLRFYCSASWALWFGCFATWRHCTRLLHRICDSSSKARIYRSKVNLTILHGRSSCISPHRHLLRKKIVVFKAQHLACVYNNLNEETGSTYPLHVCQCAGRLAPDAGSHPQSDPQASRWWWSASRFPYRQSQINPWENEMTPRDQQKYIKRHVPSFRQMFFFFLTT